MDHVPEEVLLEIFELLDSESLKDARLVCKEWDRIISTSPRTMKKVSLILTSHLLLDPDALATTKLKFHTIEIWGTTFSLHLLQAFQNNGAYVRLLKICNLSISQSVITFCTFLESLCNLEKLVIINSEWRNQTSEIPPINMKALKRLVLYNSDLCFLSLIQSKLTSLKINGRGYQYNGDLSLVPFLHNQKYLKELALKELSILKSFGETTHKFSFPLKKLSLQNMNEVSEEIILKLLHAFIDTLEEIQFQAMQISNATYRFIMNQLYKLSTLRIDIDHAPEDEGETFYLNLSPNRKIQRLVIDGDLRQESAKGIIGNCPNVHSLFLTQRHEIDEQHNEVMLFISNNLSSLKHLHVQKMGCVNLNNFKIATLESISFNNVDGMTHQQWMGLTSGKNVQHIAITDLVTAEGGRNLFPLAVLRNLKKLKHFEVGEFFRPKKDLFTNLHNECPDLKHVTLSSNAIKDDPTMVDGFKKDGLHFLLTVNPFKRQLEPLAMWPEEGSLEDENIPYHFYDDYDFENEFDDIGIDEDYEDIITDEDVFENDDFEADDVIGINDDDVIGINDDDVIEIDDDIIGINDDDDIEIDYYDIGIGNDDDADYNFADWD